MRAVLLCLLGLWPALSFAFTEKADLVVVKKSTYSLTLMKDGKPVAGTIRVLNTGYGTWKASRLGGEGGDVEDRVVEGVHVVDQLIPDRAVGVAGLGRGSGKVAGAGDCRDQRHRCGGNVRLSL